VRAGLAVVTDRIAAVGVDPDRVRICAATKGFGPEAAIAALEAGLTDIGENYAKELVAKATHVAAAGFLPRWHMIGTLQRNKVRRLAPHVALWQSVDRIELAAEIARRSPGASVLVQVNATDEATKGGCTPDDTPDLVHRFTDLGLDVQGLMTIGPTERGVDPRPAFDTVAHLARRLGLPELSMGMSNDLESAVAAGATMIRVGTALFGSRPPPVTAGHGSDE
jgi:PLP dependent protein